MALSVNTLRKIDYFAGIPLCFLATLLRLLFALTSGCCKPEQIKNVLFIGLSESGSNVLAHSALVKLKKETDATLFFATFTNNSSSIEITGAVQSANIFRMRDTGAVAVILDAFRLIGWARLNRIDTVVDLELFSRFTALLSYFSGACRRVGFYSFYNEGLYRGNLLTHNVAYNPHLHMAKNFLSLVYAVISPNLQIPYSKVLIRDDDVSAAKVQVRNEDVISIQSKIRSVAPEFDGQRHHTVIFNTNASDLVPLRRWPKEHFTRLAEIILASNPAIYILLTGVASEYAWNNSIIEAVHNERCVNIAGMTGFSELPALYQMSLYMVSNDSGPAHFASLTDLPTFVLFGPETPGLYLPLGVCIPIYFGLACSPCVSAANHRKSACSDNKCLQLITPENVFEIINSNFITEKSQ